MSTPNPEPMAPRFAALLAEIRATSATGTQRTVDAMLLASLVLILEALLSLITAWEAGQPLPAIPPRLRAPRLRAPRLPRGARTRAHHQTRPASARTKLRAPHPHARITPKPRVQIRRTTRARTPPATAPPAPSAKTPPTRQRPRTPILFRHRN